jgi:hypothetical protein
MVSACGNDTACSTAAGEFETQRQNDLQSSSADVVRGASAWGSPGDNNGILVTFKPQSDVNADANSRQNTDAFTVPTVDGPRVTATASVSESATGSQLGRAIAHEGTHLADAKKFAESWNPKTGKYSARANYTHGQTEFRAYKAGQSVKPFAGFRSDGDIQRFIDSHYQNANDPVWPEAITE